MPKIGLGQVERWVPGAEGGSGELALSGYGSVFGKMNEVLEVGVGNGYSALRTLLMPLA